MSQQLKTVVVSVQTRTELTLVVPTEIDDEIITEAVTQYYAVSEQLGFLDARGKLIPDSKAVVLKSSGEGNDVIVVSEEPNTETVDEKAVQATWAILKTNLAGSEENQSERAAEYEMNLARTDPRKLNDFALTEALKFMYPGNAPGSQSKLSKKRRLAAYRDYFGRMDPGTQVRKLYAATLARKDPATMSQTELTEHLIWMYPGNTASHWKALSARERIAAYRRYFPHPTLKRNQTACQAQNSEAAR